MHNVTSFMGTGIEVDVGATISPQVFGIVDEMEVLATI